MDGNAIQGFQAGTTATGSTRPMTRGARAACASLPARSRRVVARSAVIERQQLQERARRERRQQQLDRQRQRPRGRQPVAWARRMHTRAVSAAAAIRGSGNAQVAAAAAARRVHTRAVTAVAPSGARTGRAEMRAEMRAAAEENEEDEEREVEEESDEDEDGDGGRNEDSIRRRTPDRFLGENCTICLSPLRRSSESLEERPIYTIQNCRHNFHRDCLTRNREQGRRTCPCCRGRLERGLTPEPVRREEAARRRALLERHEWERIERMLRERQEQVRLAEVNRLLLEQWRQAHAEQRRREEAQERRRRREEALQSARRRLDALAAKRSQARAARRAAQAALAQANEEASALVAEALARGRELCRPAERNLAELKRAEDRAWTEYRRQQRDVAEQEQLSDGGGGGGGGSSSGSSTGSRGHFFL